MKTMQPRLVDDGIALTKSGLVHRVWEPDSDSPRPTIVMNHGRSGTEDVTWVFARTLPKEWLIVTPRALYADHRGGFSWDVRPAGEWPTVEAFDPAIDAFSHFINSLPHLYNADLNQMFLLGFSQGAALSYSYAMRHPEKVQGIAGLVGLMPEGVLDEPALSNLQDVPVMMAVGRKDDTIPLSVSRQCANALLYAGARLDYREYDTGHKLNARGMRDLARWWTNVTDKNRR